MNDIVVEHVTAKDKNDWLKLFAAYCDFYKVAYTETLANQVWDWLMDDKKNFYGLTARLDGAMIGFAHYRSFLNSLDGTTACFFDDLFVDAKARSKKVGRRLITAVREEAKKNGWSRVSWLTADNNYRARPLYDSLAKRTDWITYEMEI